MGIYDVGYGGFGAFQSDYRISSIPKAPETAGAAAVNTEQVQEQPKSLSIESVDTRPRATDPASVSLTFNKNSDFSQIGRDRDIAGLDMEKAISDMKQDSILQEYQYFVGSSNNVFNSEDGVVLAKMN